MYKWTNMIFYIAMVAVNTYANLAKLGGGSTGEISKGLESMITPAGWTFAIWGAIYGLLLVFIIAPFTKKGNNADSLAKDMSFWFPLSCTLNIAWIFAWHFKRITMSWVIMMGLFLCLYIMFNKITIGLDLLNYENKRPQGLSLASSGISLYFGWICIAFLANTMAMFVSLGLDGFGITARAITIIMLAVGAVLVSLISIFSVNYVFTLAAIWGYMGIMSKHISIYELGGKYIAVILALAISIVLMIASITAAISQKNSVKASAGTL